MLITYLFTYLLMLMFIIVKLFIHPRMFRHITKVKFRLGAYFLFIYSEKYQYILYLLIFFQN